MSGRSFIARRHGEHPVSMAELRRDPGKWRSRRTVLWPRSRRCRTTRTSLYGPLWTYRRTPTELHAVGFSDGLFQVTTTIRKAGRLLEAADDFLALLESAVCRSGADRRSKPRSRRGTRARRSCGSWSTPTTRAGARAGRGRRRSRRGRARWWLGRLQDSLSFLLSIAQNPRALCKGAGRLRGARP